MAPYGVDQVTKYSGWYMELLRTATDENMWTTVDSYSSFETLGDGADHPKGLYRSLLLGTDAGGYMNRRGDDAAQNGVGYPWHWESPGWTIMSYLFANRYQDPVIQMAHEITSEYRPDYYLNSWYKDRNLRYFYWCLWHNPSLTPSFDTVDKYTYFSGAQKFAWRSGFSFNTSSTDIVIASSSMKKHPYTHWTADFGHFVVTRGSDQLLFKFWHL